MLASYESLMRNVNPCNATSGPSAVAERAIARDRRQPPTGSPILDLAWFLSVNSARLPIAKEEAVGRTDTPGDQMGQSESDGRTFAEIRLRGRADRTPSAGQHAPIWRVIGVSQDTVDSGSIYVAIVTSAPSAHSDVHRRGECETAIHALSGRARFRHRKDVARSVEATAGAFVYFPVHVVHAEEHLSETEPLVVTSRTDGANPVAGRSRTRKRVIR
jgi:uncharacterized RmlC-like cupin family protein